MIISGISQRNTPLKSTQNPNFDSAEQTKKQRPKITLLHFAKVMNHNRFTCDRDQRCINPNPLAIFTAIYGAVSAPLLHCFFFIIINVRYNHSMKWRSEIAAFFTNGPMKLYKLERTDDLSTGSIRIVFCMSEQVSALEKYFTFTVKWNNNVQVLLDFLVKL